MNSMLTIKDLFITFLAMLIASSLFYHHKQRRRIINDHKDVKTARVWAPVKFKYPHFEPWLDFNTHTTKPAPYRPFRWTGYPINMGIRPMPWDAWIELDHHYLEYLEIRKARLKSRGDKVVRTLPGAERAALEACTELASYLAHRYPSVFRVERVHDSGGLGRGDSIVGHNGGRVKSIEIIPTGDKWDLDHEDPMTIAGLLADDLAVMMEGPDGLYYMQAGSICVPGSWRLEDKIGLPLAEIHLRGNVYKYKEVLEYSMNRFFSKLPVDKPVQRNNYSFQFEPGLAWLDELHGSEDDFDQQTKTPRLGTSSAKAWKHMKEVTDVSCIYFRSERQTLRRMPLTGCILFTIRTYLHPITEIVTEPGVPGRLAAAIRGWEDVVAVRKDKHLFAEVLIPWLDQLHQKQITDGLIKSDDKNSDYPY